MLDTYLTIVNHPLLWIAIGLTVTFYLITWVISLNQKSPNFSSKRWLRDHYVEVVFWLGLAAICAAFYFYLFDAGRAVAAMADELLFRARTLPETRDTGRGTEDVRGLAQGMALLLGAIVAAATIPFTMLRTWINERTATATEEGLVTDRINKAVEGLGAEKTVRKQRTDKNGSPTYGKTDGEVDYSKPVMIEVSQPNMEVRVGVIFALERIAQDSPRDHVQIMEILCAYIRQNSPRESAKPVPDLNEPDWDDDPSAGKAEEWRRELANTLQTQLKDKIKTRLDIQTALNVLGRRTAEQRQTEAEAHRGKRGDVFIFDTGFPEFPKTDGVDGLKIAEAARDYREKAQEKPKKFSAYQGYRLDLRDCNLQGYDFAGICMKGADLRGAALQGADLRGAELQGAYLGRAELQGANLESAALQGANLESAELQGANLWRAKLQGANLESAELQGANLGGAELQGANLWRAKLQGANLWGAELQGAYLGRAELQGANLRGAELQGANLRGAELQGAYLWRAKLQGANLGGAELQGADLGRAELQGANLRDAELQGADLRDAELQGADLRDAELQGADLRDAEFDEKTNLSAASLRGAALRFVDCTDLPQFAEHLNGMFGDGSVTVPKGKEWPAHWPKLALDFDEFEPEWRKWQADPEGYAPPEPPEDAAG